MSRGLGDVYKRQISPRAGEPISVKAGRIPSAGENCLSYTPHSLSATTLHQRSRCIFPGLPSPETMPIPSRTSWAFPTTPRFISYTPNTPYLKTFRLWRSNCPLQASAMTLRSSPLYTPFFLILPSPTVSQAITKKRARPSSSSI